MNILITGCAGFIGSSLINKLSSEVYIIGIDTQYVRKTHFQIFQGDIRDEELLDSILNNNKIDVIVHLAAKAGVRDSLINPAEYISVNIQGTVNILEKMRKYKIPKIIFASSSSVYGNAEVIPFREDFYNLHPISPYAATKKSCEDLIYTYSSLYGIKAVCLRFFTVYGPKQRKDLAIQKFTQAIMKNEPVTLYGDGSTYRDYTYIDDVIDSIKAALNYNHTPFEIINIGSASPVSLKNLVISLESALKKKAIIKYFPMQPGDVNRTFADISKAEKLLNYKPKFSFEEGLHRFINEFNFGK